jgi:hypothetical protein
MQRAILPSLILLVATTVAFSQSGTGTISGHLTDAAGTTFIGVTVQAVNSATGKAYGAATGEDGNYTISGLPPGTYTLSASVSYLKKYTHANLQVGASQTLREDIHLQPRELGMALRIAFRIWAILEALIGLWLLWFLTRRAVRPCIVQPKRLARVLLFACLLAIPLALVGSLIFAVLFQIMGIIRDAGNAPPILYLVVLSVSVSSSFWLLFRTDERSRMVYGRSLLIALAPLSYGVLRLASILAVQGLLNLQQ